MYWRVRKITPEQIVKHYSVHMILAASLFLNMFLFLSRPKKEVISKQQQQDYANFAKQVTSHLLDTSYINYIESTVLVQRELFSGVVAKLKQDGILPATDQDLKARHMDLAKSRRVCAVHFSSVELKDLDKNGMQPVDVQGVVVVHSADESAQQPFRFLYTIGLTKATDPPSPIVFNMQDLPPAVTAQPQSQ